MDAQKHVMEKERLNRALCGKLDEVTASIKETLARNNLDATPGIAFDTFCYVLAEMHLDKFNLPINTDIMTLKQIFKTGEHGKSYWQSLYEQETILALQEEYAVLTIRIHRLFKRLEKSEITSYRESLQKSLTFLKSRRYAILMCLKSLSADIYNLQLKCEHASKLIY